jgi:uncharacterized protein
MLVYRGDDHEGRVPMTAYASGIWAGQRRLLGPQTSGRVYRNLSTAKHHVKALLDVALPLRDGTVLRADVYLPDTDR